MIWKEIKGYENKYIISSSGIVKRLPGEYEDSIGRMKFYKGAIVSPRPNKKGYMRVTLSGRDFYVHRLVAISFIPNLESKTEVNHIDGNKSNNSLNNLEWVTRQENCHHASVSGLINKNSEKRNKQCYINSRKAIEVNSKPVIQLSLNGEVIGEYSSASEANRTLGGKGNISAVCRGERKTALGFMWKYK